MDVPKACNDPRFRGGRKLMERGKPEQAVAMFATVLEEAIHKFGEDHIDTAPAYYEYGHALFRAAEGESQKEDCDLALEQMENAFAIIDEYLSNEDNKDYSDYCREQVPRILTGIGDLFCLVDRFADAVDVYTRVVPYRESSYESLKNSNNSNKATNNNNNKNDNIEKSLQELRHSRLLCEAYVLVSETLLRCPPIDDVAVKDDEAATSRVIVPKHEIREYASGYYDKAKDQMQNVVLVMGEVAGMVASISPPPEIFKKAKEDVCFLATLLMGVGSSLAEREEEELAAIASNSSSSPNKKLKK